MITLSNNILQIEVALKGAELQSIYNKPLQLEYLWSGDPAYWAKKSPVLFPIVGGLKNGKYTYQGKEYAMGRHGFARDMEFSLVSETENSITLSLVSNEQTLRLYPFEFIFSITYTLTDNLLEINYTVQNTGGSQMFFSVGAHPAFKIPIDEGTHYDEYFLLFNRQETAGRYPLSADGLTEIIPETFFTGTNTLLLRKELFEKDALVFKELESTEISIAGNRSTHGIKVKFDGFPFMGIWAAKDADFICIEPWDGIADRVDASGELENKEGILSLAAADVYNKAFTITTY